MTVDIARELEDFTDIWNRTFFHPETGRVRPAGGTTVKDGDGIEGVDYAELIAWTKGNSVSTDQHTIHDFVEYFDMLFAKMRDHLMLVDLGKEPDLAGLTYRDFTKKGQLVAGRGSRRYNAGWPTDKGEKVEVLLCQLLRGGLVDLYLDEKTLNTNAINSILEEINVTSAACLQDDTFIRGRGVIYHLSISLGQRGHVRLSRAWETIVRDHFGAPVGIPGAIPGSLTAVLPANTARTMPVPIHYAIAEVLAKYRKAVVGGLSAWGKNQLKVRQALCDLANDRGSDTVSLNDYYRIYREHSVLHMADSELSRSEVDASRPSYVIQEIPGSSPIQWTVTLDPGLIRWRINQRTRQQLREGNSGTEAADASGTTGE